MMKKETLTRSVSPSLFRIFISMIILSSMLVLSLTPCAASLLKTEPDQPSMNLTEPTESKTTPAVEESSPDAIVEEQTSTEESDLVTSVEGTEPSGTEIDTTLSENTVTQSESTDIKTLSITALDELYTGTIIGDTIIYDSIIEENTISSLTSTSQDVELTVTSSQTSTKTSVNTLTVITKKQITDISAEISITQNVPQYVPSLAIAHQNECIASYVTVHFLADNAMLSADEIDSMTMTFKIKKDQSNLTAQNTNQFYVLTYNTDPLFVFSHPFLQNIVITLSSGTWHPITPVEITEDEEYIYYHIKTSSYFATFAIVGTELVEIQPYQSGIPEVPWCIIIVTIIFSTTLLLVVLFKTGFIYQVEELTERKNKGKSLNILNQKWSYKVKLTTTPPELQLLRTPTFYFTSAPSPPQVITASAQEHQSMKGLEDDPMYL